MVPPIAYSSVKAIEEKTTVMIPDTTLAAIIEVLFFPINFNQYLTITHPVAHVTIAIFKTFTPSALKPPSAKSKD